MSSHILMTTVTAIALSTPAWADDPAEVPSNVCLEAILFDPAEAPIDREMKILWLEHIEALFQENPAAAAEAIRSGLGGQAAARTGFTLTEHRPAPTSARLAGD
jgi:hypothetical protein